MTKCDSCGTLCEEKEKEKGSCKKCWNIYGNFMSGKLMTGPFPMNHKCMNCETKITTTNKTDYKEWCVDCLSIVEKYFGKQRVPSFGERNMASHRDYWERFSASCAPRCSHGVPLSMSSSCSSCYYRVMRYK